jgi:similar to spore coat protein
LNTIVENLTGMDTMTDRVIASDLLISAKTGIKSYAVALTETATPEVRTVLRRHFDQAVNVHEQISSFMMNQGWYHAYNIDEQIKLDMKNANTALNLPQT